MSLKIFRIIEFRRKFFISDDEPFSNSGNYLRITRIKLFGFIPIKFKTFTFGIDNCIYIARSVFGEGNQMEINKYFEKYKL